MIATSDNTDIPLCVDLDGTLIKTDTLHESLLVLVKHAPLEMLATLAWLLKGKAHLKSKIAERVEIDPATLPLCDSVVKMIDEAKREGRKVILVTAASACQSQAIADHLGLFDDVISSDERTNLSADAKADALVERYGTGKFDYIGNHRHDFPVLAVARQSFLVANAGALRRAATKVKPDIGFIVTTGPSARTWLRELRVHQWLKNLLVFVPLLASHRFFDINLVVRSLMAFIAFSLCASSVYVLNDLLDLSADRLHHSKRRRPFASGEIPIASGVFAIIPLLLLSFGVSLFLPGRFLFVLGIYYVLTNLYSLRLKRQVVVDVMLLATLYTIRILAGAAAIQVDLSFWLLAFSMFLFLGLAMVKRYSELRQAIMLGKTLAGRGYHPDDLPVVMAIGSASSMISVLILALYTQSEIVPNLYSSPRWLWLIPPAMLYWSTRLWMKAHRGEVDDDPVVFAATDWQSLLVVCIIGLCFLFAALKVWPL